MEIQVPYSILFTFFCFLLLIHRLSRSTKSSKPLPPGPPRLPLIGNLHQLIGSLPHRRLKDLANKYGPLMYLQLGQTSNLVVTSAEVVKEITKTHDIVFANRPKILVSEVFCYNSTDLVFAPYGNYWRLLRKICTLELLSAKRVQSFRKIREEEVSQVMNFIGEQEGSLVNLSKIISPITNSIVARAAFGKKTKNVEQILTTLAYTVELASGFSVSDLYPSLKFLNALSGTQSKVAKAHKEVDRLLGNIIDDHMGKEVNYVDGEIEEDLVDVLLRVQKQNDDEVPISLNNIKAVVLDIFVGGTETSGTTIEWAMSELMNLPGTMKKAQDEVRRVYGNKGYVDESELHQLKYIPAIIKEALRLHPPGSLLVPRENSESVEIDGYEVPSKCRVMINAWALGRDPKYWKNAEKFQPERFFDSPIDYKNVTNYEYIPFGFGRRICPGITFATPVLQLILANLLYHFDWKLPSGTTELDMTEVFGATVRRKNDLCVVPIRHHPN